MKLRSAFAGLLILFLIACTQTNKLALSPNLYLMYETPQEIVHTNGMLLLVYNSDYAISHEQVTPTTFYYGEDLTGYLDTYVRSLFNPSLRKSLPAGLAQLSKAQALIFDITSNKVIRSQINGMDLFAVYIKEDFQGEVFVMDSGGPHRLTIKKVSEYEFRQFIAAIGA